MRGPETARDYREASTAWIVVEGLLLSSLCLTGIAAASRGKTEEPGNHALAEARAAILERHYSAAVHLLKNALERFPEDNRLRVELGRAYLYKGNAGRAMKLFREALRREPTNRLAKLELARALGYHRDYKASSQLYRELLAVNGDDEAAATGLVNNLMHQRQTAEALRVANQALARHPNSLRLQEYRDRLTGGEFGGNEREPLRRPNQLLGGGDYISDSAGSRSWGTLQRLDYEVAPAISNQLAIEERWLSSTQTDEAPAAVAAATDQLHLRLTDTVMMSLGGGGVRFGDGAGRTLYRAGLELHPAKHLWLEGGFSRAPFYPDTKAASFDLTTEGWEALLDWQPALWQVNAWWSKEHYSDGNVAKRGGAEVVRWIGSPRFAFGAGYRFTHYDFLHQFNHGYFNPEEYQSHLGLTGVKFRLGKAVHGEYVTRVGAESISQGGPFQAAWEVSLRNWVSLGHWEVGGDYFYFHLAQNTGAFVARAGGLNVRYRF